MILHAGNGAESIFVFGRTPQLLSKRSVFKYRLSGPKAMEAARIHPLYGSLCGLFGHDVRKQSVDISS